MKTIDAIRRYARSLERIGANHLGHEPRQRAAARIIRAARLGSAREAGRAARAAGGSGPGPGGGLGMFAGHFR